MTRSTREGVLQTLRQLGLKSSGVTILGQGEMTVRSQSRDKQDSTHTKELSARVANPQRFGVCTIRKVNTLSVIFDRRAKDCGFAGSVPASNARKVASTPCLIDSNILIRRVQPSDLGVAR
jgi:hypothetical protein